MAGRFGYLEARKLFVDGIKKEIEEGTAFWMKPWTLSPAIPRNGVYNKEYKGVNLLYLFNKSKEDPRWYTLNQAAKLGYELKEDVEPVQIEYWNHLYIKEEKRYQIFCKPYDVYNGSSFYGIVPYQRPVLNVDSGTKDTQLEEICAPYLPISEFGDYNASYIPSKDQIRMPARENFQTNDDYYATYLHEIAHATSNPNRIGRKNISTTDYGHEELVAEIASALIMIKLQLNVTEEFVAKRVTCSAAYVKGWLDGLDLNWRLFFNVIKESQRIVDFVLSGKKD